MVPQEEFIEITVEMRWYPQGIKNWSPHTRSPSAKYLLGEGTLDQFLLSCPKLLSFHLVSRGSNFGQLKSEVSDNFHFRGGGGGEPLV